jgi:Tfp pilus assembly protein PilZ
MTDSDTPPLPVPGLEWLSVRGLSSRSLLSRINGLLLRHRESLHVEERVSFVCPVEFRQVGATSWSSCYSSALSPGALFVRTLVPARTGAALELRIHLPTTREVIEGPGLVAWSNPYSPRRLSSYPLGMGIQFLGANPGRLMLLRELLHPDDGH